MKKAMYCAELAVQVAQMMQRIASGDYSEQGIWRLEQEAARAVRKIADALQEDMDDA